jgi:peroxiredoxin family protein
MKRGNPEQVRATLFEVIENQLRANDPPETQETLNRLVAEGHTRDEAVKLIACALVIEIYDVLKTQAPYDHARYAANLRRLPALPDE